MKNKDLDILQSANTEYFSWSWHIFGTFCIFFYPKRAMRFVNLSFVLIINKHDPQKPHLYLYSEITSLKGA